jgi:hypothetical protein
MKKEDIEAQKDVILELFDTLIDQPCTIEVFQNEIVINEWLALKVYGIDSSIDLDDDIIINKADGHLGAILCPVGAPGNDFEINEFNHNRLISFIHDVELNEFSASTSHSFNCHFLLVKKEFFIEYVNEFKASSALWGGFTHEEPVTSFSRKIATISVRPSIFIPSARHAKSLTTAIAASTAFERYLKYYHQIELLFDIIFVAKIKKLPASISGFGDVMKDYQKKECDILKLIFKDYIQSSSDILDILRGCSPFVAEMKIIFQDNGKESNPVKDERWVSLIHFLQMNSINQTHVKAKENKLIGVSTAETLNEYLANVVAYWIYRVRCSIAHNREGEFIFEQSHEKFVVEFAEILLKEVIQQIFSNPKLKQVLL